jgi:anti-anti-sigma factor
MLRSRVRLLHVDVRWDGHVATAAVTGELDFTTAPGLTQRLLEVAQSRPQRLVLDLHAVAFLDLSGARAIATIREVLGGACPVILLNPRPSARKVLAATGLPLGDTQRHTTLWREPIRMA